MIIRFRDSAILNEIGVIHPIAIEMIYTFFAATFFIRKYKKYPALGRLLKLLGLFCPERKKNYHYWILIRFLWNLSLFFMNRYTFFVIDIFDKTNFQITLLLKWCPIFVSSPDTNSRNSIIFFGKNLSIFVFPDLKLHNRYCNSEIAYLVGTKLMYLRVSTSSFNPPSWSKQ